VTEVPEKLNISVSDKIIQSMQFDWSNRTSASIWK